MDLRALRRSAGSLVPERVLSASAASIALATREALEPGTAVDVILEYPEGSPEVLVRGEVIQLREGTGLSMPFVAAVRLIEIGPEQGPNYHTLLLHLLELPQGPRSSRRLDIRADARWSPSRGASGQPVTVVDISHGGAMLQGRELPRPGATGFISLSHVADRHTVSIPVKAIWHRPGLPEEYAGISFDASPETREVIQQVLRWFLFTRSIIGPTAQVGSASVRVGAFELLSMLARGGMCDVYQARGIEKPFANLPVALKRLRPSSLAVSGTLDRFLTEADLGRMLSHPNLVRVHATFEHDDEYWTAMELVEGPSLETVLTALGRSGRPPPIPMILAIAQELLDVLEYCHQFELSSGKPLEIVHGDVTPSNVLLDRKGAVKLIDFGVATTAVPETTDLVGVPAKLSYLPPELYLKGQKPAPTVDLYQMGVLLYEAVTGEKPFRGAAADEICAAVRKGAVPPGQLNPQVPVEVENVILEALNANPKKRPKNAGAFLRELKKSVAFPAPAKIPELLARAATFAEPR